MAVNGANTPPMPPLPGVNSLPRWLTFNPVKVYHGLLFNSSKSERLAIDHGYHRVRMFTLLANMVQDRCYPVSHPERANNCECMKITPRMSRDERHAVVDYLLHFAALKKTEQQNLVIQWIRYAAASGTLLAANKVYTKKVYILPGTSEFMICRSALQRVVGYSTDAWKTVERCALQNEIPTHGLMAAAANRTPKHYPQILAAFFSTITELAAPRATRLVRCIVRDDSGYQDELRDDDPELIELPPSLNKVGLYKRFLHEHGWKPVYDAKHRLLKMEPVGGHTREYKKGELPSETAFLNYWQKNHPKLVTQRPRNDICGQCYVFANRFRYLHKKQEDGGDDEDEDKQGVIPWVNNAPGKRGEERDRLIAEREALLLKASRHVLAAQKQREFANVKREEAFQDRDKAIGERCITLVADFAQNAYVPNFSSEQPGETYYYAPANAYIFGVADCSNKPTTLTAHCFMEGEATKGGNTVASLLWKECQRLGLVPARDQATRKILNSAHQPAKEINIIMDNCIGQNKNNMVLRLLFFMVSRKLCLVARAIFLVKGVGRYPYP